MLGRLPSLYKPACGNCAVFFIKFRAPLRRDLRSSPGPLQDDASGLSFLAISATKISHIRPYSTEPTASRSPGSCMVQQGWAHYHKHTTPTTTTEAFAFLCGVFAYSVPGASNSKHRRRKLRDFETSRDDDEGMRDLCVNLSVSILFCSRIRRARTSHARLGSRLQPPLLASPTHLPR